MSANTKNPKSRAAKAKGGSFASGAYESPVGSSAPVAQTEGPSIPIAQIVGSQQPVAEEAAAAPKTSTDKRTRSKKQRNLPVAAPERGESSAQGARTNNASASSGWQAPPVDVVNRAARTLDDAAPEDRKVMQTLLEMAVVIHDPDKKKYLPDMTYASSEQYWASPADLMKIGTRTLVKCEGEHRVYCEKMHAMALNVTLNAQGIEPKVFHDRVKRHMDDNDDKDSDGDKRPEKKSRYKDPYGRR